MTKPTEEKPPDFTELAGKATNAAETWERWARMTAPTPELSMGGHAMAELFAVCSRMLDRMSKQPCAHLPPKQAYTQCGPPR